MNPKQKEKWEKWFMKRADNANNWAIEDRSKVLIGLDDFIEAIELALKEGAEVEDD